MRVAAAGAVFEVRERTDDAWTRVQNGGWEPHTLAALAQFEPGDLFVDIGAYIGATTLPAAARGARCLSYEPDPIARAELQENVARSGFDALVTVRPVALSDRDAEMQLTAPHVLGDSMSSIARPTRGSIGNRAALVQVEDVRGHLDAFRGARMVKVDVEGGEYALLPAMRAWITTERPDLMLSLHTYHWNGLLDRLPRLARPAVLRALTLRYRRRLLWLAAVYPHVLVESADTWQPVGSAEFRRRLLQPGEVEFYLSTEPRAALTSR